MALRVDNTEDPDKFKCAGRGELYLSILIETMRREGYELAVSRPQVIIKEVDGVRRSGALISNAAGKATGYSLWNLEERGKLCIGSQTEVYEGMIVGFHNRSNDLVVNVIRPKQLTNIRASGSDENIMLTPPLRMTLEQALEFINDDELVEVTPTNLRLRKKLLKENERKRGGRI